MKTASILKAACMTGLIAVCAWSMVACTSKASESTDGYTGGVAATVNGTEIPEDTITKEVEAIRTQMAVNTEEAWGAWLIEYNYTPETVRTEIINEQIEQELVRQGAAENGVTVDSSEIDSNIASVKSYYNDDEAWQEALANAGTTDEEYRQNTELSLLYEGLYKTFASSDDISEEEMLSNAQTYISSFDGAKRSSHILFETGDDATAQSVLDRINSGELDFAAAAQEYSIDSSGKNGGDVGWDVLNSFVEEYQTALSGLEKDQISGLVVSQYGIHIIKCTDVFTAPEEITSSDQLPEEFREQISAMIVSTKQSEGYQTWYTEYKESADIVINEMPEGLPYDIDLTPYQTGEGNKVTNEDGSTTVTSDNGSSTTTYTDGSTMTVYPDGTSVEVDAGGYVTHYDANGNAIAGNAVDISGNEAAGTAPDSATDATDAG